MLEFTKIAHVSSSTGIFTSRIQEIQVRRFVVKRLNFCIYSAPFDYFFPKLPAIQELLVDTLKTLDPLLHAEVFFTFMLLIIRISKKYLGNFWPILINELVNLFVI
jgi:hypothetical protein